MSLDYYDLEASATGIVGAIEDYSARCELVKSDGLPGNWVTVVVLDMREVVLLLSLLSPSRDPGIRLLRDHLAEKFNIRGSDLGATDGSRFPHLVDESSDS